MAWKKVVLHFSTWYIVVYRVRKFNNPVPLNYFVLALVFGMELMNGVMGGSV